MNLASLPPFIRDRALDWIEPDYPEGTPDSAKTEARKQSEERGESVLPGPGGTGTEIRDVFGIPGTVLVVRVVDRAAGKVEITAPRKAFRIDLDKDALLPGVDALGGTYEGEQELHGLERVNPWKIKSAHTAESLQEEFPVTAGAEPAQTGGSVS